jgi:hypothetical protein
MSPGKKKTIRKARPGHSRGNWRDRVDPAFISWWTLRKENLSLSKIKDEEQFERKFKEWRKRFGPVSKAFDQALRRIKDPVARPLGLRIGRRLDTEGPMIVPAVARGEEGRPYPENPESSSLFRQLVFLKYGIAFYDLIWQIDINHDAVAHRRLMAVHRDYWRLLKGARLEDLKLRFSSHFGIITQGLDFGLAGLTPDELADCLDEICPCGLKHSSTYLKKLRARIRKACNRNEAPLLPPASKASQPRI